MNCVNKKMRLPSTLEGSLKVERYVYFYCLTDVQGHIEMKKGTE